MNIKEYIRTVPNYPVAGVNFYDLNSLFSSDMWSSYVSDLASAMELFNPTHIVGIESRGFVVGAAIAQEMNAFYNGSKERC